jgi:class 3 adenylate cyclase
MTDATNAYDLGTLTLCENMDVDLASLLTVKPNNGNELLSSVGFFDAKSALRSEPIIAHMLENQMTFICEDIKESPFAIPTFLLKQNIQSLMVAMVKRDGNPYAILSVYKVEQHRWSRDEIAFLEGMARTLGGIAEKHYAAQVLAEAKQKSDRLLGQMLPASTIRQLQAQEDSNLAEGIANATVMFADIVGFTELANSIRPKELVQFLSFIFCAIDELAEKHGVMKVKTVGDAYMCATGVVSHEDDHAEVMLRFAFEVINFVNSPEVQTKHPISIRIGISSGPVVAGVIGKQRQVYDIYGDTVNVAARMESLGQPQRIQISKKTLDMLIRNDTTSQFVIEPRGTIAVKGKGKMDTMWASPVKKETTLAGKETKPEIAVA